MPFLLPNGAPYARLVEGDLHPDHFVTRALEAREAAHDLQDLFTLGATADSHARLRKALALLARARLLVHPTYEALVQQAEREGPDGVFGLASALAAQRGESPLWALRGSGARSRELQQFLLDTIHPLRAALENTV